MIKQVPFTKQVQKHPVVAMCTPTKTAVRANEVKVVDGITEGKRPLTSASEVRLNYLLVTQ